MSKMHTELERTISKHNTSRHVSYQISISDHFYKKYFSFCGLPYETETVVENRQWISDITDFYIYQPLQDITKKSLTTHLTELNTLVDISQSRENFDGYFTQKYHYLIPDELKNPSSYFQTPEKTLSDFDKKLKQALNFKPQKQA